MKILYLECKMGAAGDMLMSALYELMSEEQREVFLTKINGLGLPGVYIRPQTAVSCNITGTHMCITVHGKEESAHCDNDHVHGHNHHDDEHKHGHPHHHASPDYITRLIDELDLPAVVKAQAKAVYDAIAQAEAKSHGCPVAEVHFHEVGALDAVADVTGVCYAMELLNPDQIVVSPIHVGSGTVRCAHGIMPVPAPATTVLLSGAPIYGGSIQGELCTPTGAALLTRFADSFGPMPMMTVERVGYGLGSREFEQANCVRAFFGEAEMEGRGEILELVCNLDDMTPEALSFACTRLLELGALDVYTVPGTMKKGRAGWVLTVLCCPERETEVVRHILRETTTNGLRVRRCGKYFLAPSAEEVQTHWGMTRLKTAESFGIRHVKPEFEDAAQIARENSLPYESVVNEIRKKM